MVRQKYLDSICLLVVVLALVLSLVFLGGTSITGSAREPEDAGLRTALAGADRYALFTLSGEALELPLQEGGTPNWQELPREKCVLWVGGGVTGPLLRTLARRGAPIVVAAPDATHFLMDRAAMELFQRCGGELLVRQSLTISAVTANPWSAYGKHLDGPALLSALREAVEVPVVDVRAEDE